LRLPASMSRHRRTRKSAVASATGSVVRRRSLFVNWLAICNSISRKTHVKAESYCSKTPTDFLASTAKARASSSRLPSRPSSFTSDSRTFSASLGVSLARLPGPTTLLAMVSTMILKQSGQSGMSMLISDLRLALEYLCQMVREFGLPFRWLLLRLGLRFAFGQIIGGHITRPAGFSRGRLCSSLSACA
jgi:hypothetical protein